MTDTDVLIVGGGVAGLSAAIYTARADMETLVVDADESILERNAHLENFPGFPAGVDARRFLSMTREQAEGAGARFREERVVDVVPHDEESGFTVELGAGEELTADYVVAASWSDAAYLEDVEGVGLVQRGSKRFVDVDEHGFTGVAGLYAAGRIAEKHHQAVVAAGHGAEVALAILEASDVPFYHDWVTPEGYFTGRGREIPPGCEEIDDAEREERAAHSREVMREAFSEPYPDEPTMHPSVEE
ncbi:MAG: NAD(P)/FAD-dependent oxidoreductase [Haloarculaceae archaeon]